MGKIPQLAAPLVNVRFLNTGETASIGRSSGTSCSGVEEEQVDRACVWWSYGAGGSFYILTHPDQAQFKAAVSAAVIVRCASAGGRDSEFQRRT